MSHQPQFHFLDCTCQCQSRRQLLEVLLADFNEFSISRRSFLLIYPVVLGKLKPSHVIQYDEYQCIGVPMDISVMGHLRGNIGDLYIDKTPGSYALYAKTSATEWKKWPGPLSIGTNALRHPLYPHYVLWCNPSTMTISWFFDILVNKASLYGSAHDIIYALLQERRAEANLQTRNKQLGKRNNCPSQGQEVTPQVTAQQKGKWITDTPHNDSQVITTKLSASPTMSVDPTSASLEETARLKMEAISLNNGHAALQELVTSTHLTPSLAAPEKPVSSQQNVSNFLDSLRQSLHSSIPDDTITTSRPGLGSGSPKPSKLDVPLNPLPPCMPDLHNEGDCNLRSSSANAADDSSQCMDTVPTTLDTEKEANDNASSSVNTTDAINHNRSFTETVKADDRHQMAALGTYEDDSMASRESSIDLPSNGVDSITHGEPDGHCDIDTGNFVETAASGCLSPASIPSERDLLEREERMSPKHQSADSQVRGTPDEGASHVTIEASCLDLHSDEAFVTMDVTSDPEKKSHMICSHPFPQQMDPPPTTPGDNIVTKDITPALSDESKVLGSTKFQLNCSLKEIIFHISRNLELICRLCLGTGSLNVHVFSMDVPLEDLSDHCVKEHFEFCEILRELSVEELDGLLQHFSKNL